MAFTTRYMNVVSETKTLSGFFLASLYNWGADVATITNIHGDSYTLSIGESVVLGNDRDAHTQISIAAPATKVKITYNEG